MRAAAEVDAVDGEDLHEDAPPAKLEDRVAVAPILQQAADAEDDLIAGRKRQLAELDAAWERADSAVRQAFLRHIGATCATEWPVDD